MNKLYVSLLLVATSVISNAQEFYFRAGGGYTIPQAAQTLDGTAQPYSGSLSGNVYSLENASFSSGAQGYIGIGYMFSEHFGVQFDGNFGLRNTKYSFTAPNVNVNGIQSDVNIVQRAKSLAIVMPSLLLQTGRDNAKFYVRAGLALPVSTKIIQDQIITNAPGTGAITTDDFTLQLTNGFSLGFTGAAGIKYKVSDNISVWGELSFLSMSLYLKEADLTAASENGQSVPLSQIVGAQMIKYSKNAAVDSTGASQPTYSQPFSNFGINIGISFDLSGESHPRSRFSGDREDTDRPTSGRFH